jgi:hypothetical protein
MRVFTFWPAGFGKNRVCPLFQSSTFSFIQEKYHSKSKLEPQPSQDGKIVSELQMRLLLA